MSKYGILVADGARARFITLKPLDELTPEHGTQLIEHSDIINPEGDLPDRELFSDRPGRTHGSPSGSAHGPDDHRSAHRQELARRFARRVLEAAQRFVDDGSLDQLVIAAEPRLLGILRAERERHPLSGASVVDVAEDLSRRTLNDIAGALSHRGLIPAAQPPRAGVYHPRGQAPSPR
jgi:protein required for attachment to host cells